MPLVFAFFVLYTSFTTGYFAWDGFLGLAMGIMAIASYVLGVRFLTEPIRKKPRKKKNPISLLPVFASGVLPWITFLLAMGIQAASIPTTIFVLLATMGAFVFILFKSRIITL